jgi:hypothetical protein
MDDVDDEFEMNRMKQDFERGLESIDPLNRTDDSGTEALPDPGDGSTAARPLRNRLRPVQTWR